MSAGWLGLAEVAEVVGISRSLAAQWHHRGHLPTADARLAMGPLWRAETIDTWLLDPLTRARKSVIVEDK